MTRTPMYKEYVRYHQLGDANIEGRCIANICNVLSLSEWDRFRFCYYYATVYNIDSALRLLENPKLSVREVNLRTDRRYVRCNGAFARILQGLTMEKLLSLQSLASLTEAVNTVKSWYFFGRYSSFLFLETFLSVFKPRLKDDLMFDWASNENHIRGAKTLIVENDAEHLNELLNELKRLPTERDNANSLAIETSLCGWWKILKGTRWQGFYAERLINEASQSRFGELILRSLD